VGKSNKKYTAICFIEPNKPVSFVSDFRTQKIIGIDNVKGLEKLNNLRIGDTVNVAFNKGLLGVPFGPTIK
jgi:hypothetical protein